MECKLSLCKYICHIGDTLHDFELAQALNTQVILIASGHNHYQKLAKTGAITLHHFNNLKDYLMAAFSD